MPGRSIVEQVRVIDGTGAPAFLSDVALSNRRIEAIQPSMESVAADCRIDGRNLVLTPGFIDVHTHSDLTVPADPRTVSQSTQGVTAQVVGNCGFSAAPLGRRSDLKHQMLGPVPDTAESWSDFASYRDCLDRLTPNTHITRLVGHAALGRCRDQCLVVSGHLVPGAGAGAHLSRARNPREVLHDEVFDLLWIEVAHGDHGHQIRSVPVEVESLQHRVTERSEYVFPADRKSLGVACTLEEHRKLLVQHAHARPTAQPPLLDHDLPFLVDFGAVQTDVLRPLGENQERALQRVRGVGGDRQRVHGLVERRVGVDIGAETHADPF